MERQGLRILELILIVFVLNGCDPAIVYEYYINNQSDSTLTVKFKGEGFNRTDSDSTKIVRPKTEILIYETEVWGSNPHDEKNDFLIMFDTISIMTNSKILIKKDIYNRDYWEYDNDIVHFGLIKTGTNIYRLNLTNEDLK
jgi:hypothetical protein